jgi:hypothetical protein
MDMGRVSGMIRAWGVWKMIRVEGGVQRMIGYGERVENNKSMGRVWRMIMVWGECGK